MVPAVSWMLITDTTAVFELQQRSACRVSVFVSCHIWRLLF